MALTDYIERTDDILTAAGLGEKPAIRQCAATPSVTVSGKTVDITMASGEGAKIRPGHVLSSIGAADEDEAYCFYVLSISTDTVTCLNGYKGTAIAGLTSELDDNVLQQGGFTEHSKIKRIEAIFAKYLWPEAYVVDSGTIVSPSMSDGQDELPATVMKLMSAQQVIGGEVYDIASGLKRNVHTGVSSTGVLGSFDYHDATAAYYTFMRKLALGDESIDDAIVEMVALGASALLAGADVTASSRERSKKDSQARGRLSPANQLWRDFITLRNQYAEDLGEETALGFTYHRG